MNSVMEEMSDAPLLVWACRERGIRATKLIPAPPWSLHSNGIKDLERQTAAFKQRLRLAQQAEPVGWGKGLKQIQRMKGATGGLSALA